jgi:tetratricopeptide (TPR) repeat protein
MISRIYSFIAAANQHLGLYVEADLWSWRAIEFGLAKNAPFAQAVGYEFLAEDCIHKGDYKAGLEYAEREGEVVDKLHSRERKAWQQYATAMCAFLMGDLERAELEFTEGIATAESIGERRATLLLKENFAVLLADKASRLSNDNAGEQLERQRLFDEALAMALESFEAGESLGLVYTRFEGHRCLVEVRYRRGEFDEAERLCAAAYNFISKTESRVCHLWLGPLYFDVLLAGAKQAETEGRPDDATAKRRQAADLLIRYQELVSQCQSPRFTREAERLAATQSETYVVGCEPLTSSCGENENDCTEWASRK